jgi:hypothetical protein
VENLTVQVEKDRFYDLQTRLQKQPLSLPSSALPMAAPAPFTPQPAPVLAPYITNASRSHSVGSLAASASSPPTSSSFFSADPAADEGHHHHDYHHHHDHHHDHPHHDHHHHDQHIDITVDKTL